MKNFRQRGLLLNRTGATTYSNVKISSCEPAITLPVRRFKKEKAVAELIRNDRNFVPPVPKTEVFCTFQSAPL